MLRHVGKPIVTDTAWDQADPLALPIYPFQPAACKLQAALPLQNTHAPIPQVCYVIFVFMKTLKVRVKGTNSPDLKIFHLDQKNAAWHMCLALAGK